MTEATESTGRRTYRAGVAVALLAAFLTGWTTVVRDDGTGAGYFMIILAVMVGWFSARFQPAGMARTMIGVAIMQGLLGVLVATAPVTASVPDGSLNALLFSGFFSALWLISAALFLSAARSAPQAAAPR